MKKKSFTFILCAVLLITSLMGSQIYAVDDSLSSFENMRDQLIKSNNTLKKLEYAQSQAFSQYNNAAQLYRNINTKRATFKIFGEDFLFDYDIYTQMQLSKQKELVPEQLKYNWIKSFNSSKTAQVGLIFTLRDLYIGVYSANNDVKTKQKRLNIMDERNQQSKLKYDKGFITEVDLEEAAYNFLKAQKDLDIAKRKKEKLNNSLNLLLGVPLSNIYNNTSCEERLDNTGLFPVEQYVKGALSERSEIINLKKEIELKESEKAIMERDMEVLRVYKDAKKDYDDVVKSIAKLKLQFEKVELDVENELQQAYIDIQKERDSLESMKNILALQKKNLAKVNAQYKAGMIVKTVVDEMETAVGEVECRYQAAVFSYNTKLQKLQNAAGLGPAYKKG